MREIGLLLAQAKWFFARRPSGGDEGDGRDLDSSGVA